MLGDVNKLFVLKSFLATPSNVLPLHLKQTFPPIYEIITEGDGIQFRLPKNLFYFTCKIGIEECMFLKWLIFCFCFFSNIHSEKKSYETSKTSTTELLLQGEASSESGVCNLDEEVRKKITTFLQVSKFQLFFPIWIPIVLIY